jgi:RNA polymerase sigma factor (TIGR02999 family)
LVQIQSIIRVRRLRGRIIPVPFQDQTDGIALRDSVLKVLPMSEVTRILSAIEQGDAHVAQELLPLVYDELRKLAAQRLAEEKPGQTLQATALVHEAYIRLVDVGPEKARYWNSRGHFFGAAAEAMRRILIEQARRKRTLKGGGELRRIELTGVDPVISGPNLDLLALNDALEKLAAKDPRKAELVKLRFFAGLTNEQVAEALGVATSTVDADWAYAKSWLRVEMSADSSATSS